MNFADTDHKKELSLYCLHINYSYVTVTIFFLWIHCLKISVTFFRNLKKTEGRKRKLEDLVNSVGQKVSELKDKYVGFVYFKI